MWHECQMCTVTPCTRALCVWHSSRIVVNRCYIGRFSYPGKNQVGCPLAPEGLDGYCSKNCWAGPLEEGCRRRNQRTGKCTFWNGWREVKHLVADGFPFQAILQDWNYTKYSIGWILLHIVIFRKFEILPNFVGSLPVYVVVRPLFTSCNNHWTYSDSHSDISSIRLQFWVHNDSTEAN